MASMQLYREVACVLVVATHRRAIKALREVAVFSSAVQYLPLLEAVDMLKELHSRSTST